jgi:hypothetical protein
MKKLSILTLTMIAITGFMATTVRAQSPHYIKGPTASFDSSTGDLCVSFKEAGLGTATSVTYTISVETENFTFQCFTKSSNTPHGDPNGQSFSGVSSSTTLTPRNGQVTGTLCVSACQGTAGCQGGGLVLKLLAANYLNVTFSDGITAAVPLGDQGGSVSPPARFPNTPTGNCP